MRVPLPAAKITAFIPSLQIGSYRKGQRNVLWPCTNLLLHCILMERSQSHHPPAIMSNRSCASCGVIAPSALMSTICMSSGVTTGVFQVEKQNFNRVRFIYDTVAIRISQFLRRRRSWNRCWRRLRRSFHRNFRWRNFCGCFYGNLCRRHFRWSFHRNFCWGELLWALLSVPQELPWEFQERRSGFPRGFPAPKPLGRTIHCKQSTQPENTG